MNNNQYTYNQPPMGQMPPQQPPMSMRQRMLNGMGRMRDLFPQWLTQYSIVVYILALMAVSFMYSAYSLPWYYMLSGVVAVVAFFLYGRNAMQETSVNRVRKMKTFEKKVFLIAFVPRIILMLLLYWVFQTNYGDFFGFENGDAPFYHDLGMDFAEAIKNGEFLNFWKRTSQNIEISDMGYGAYLGLVYALTNGSALIARLLKCVFSALTVVLVYRLAKRNFNEQTARLTAIFCAMWPNFWYYCTCHLKETEMVFLTVLFIEQADQMLRSRQFTAWKVLPVLLIVAIMFTFRTPLALVALLALVFSVVMSSSKVVSWGKRIMVGILAILLIGVTMGNRIEEQSRSLFEQARSNGQQSNMEWRARRDNGNAFAKYAGATVFAPLIFTLPFPTMVQPFDGQDIQQFLNGGNFIKNIISFFTIVAMIALLVSGKWRDYLLPLSFMLGYLVVLVFSSYAQSERFHQPALPFELMFAAYGLSIAVEKKKYKRWFTYWCGVMFFAAIVWNWFKLAGRGLS